MGGWLLRTSVIRILLLSNSLHSTIESREKTSPDSKVTSKHRSAGLDGCESTDAALAVWRVAEAFDAVPDRTADCLEEEKLVYVCGRAVILAERLRREADDCLPSRSWGSAPSVSSSMTW